MKKYKFLYWLIKRMSKRLKYLTAIDVIAYATVGKYSKTVVSELTAMEATKRFADDFNIE